MAESNVETQHIEEDRQHDGRKEMVELTSTTTSDIIVKKEETHIVDEPSRSDSGSTGPTKSDVPHEGASVDTDIDKRVKRKLAFRILPLLCISSFCFFTNRTQLSLAAKGMMSDLGVDRSQFGLAISSYSVAYALLIVPASILASKIGIRLSLTIMLLSFGITSMTISAVTTFGGLIGARIALGIVQSGWISTVSSYNGKFFDDGMSRAMAMTVSLGTIKHIQITDLYFDCFPIRLSQVVIYGF